jgi:hypothetical protein
MLHEERRKPRNHLEDEVAQRPPVHAGTDIDSLLEYLRGQVLRRARNEVSLLELLEFAAEAEVDQPDVALPVNEYVFRFEAAWGGRYSR